MATVSTHSYIISSIYFAYSLSLLILNIFVLWVRNFGAVELRGCTLRELKIVKKFCPKMGFSDLLRVKISRKIEFFSQKNIKFSRKPIKIEFFTYIAKSTFFRILASFLKF